ncbi:hypothetical protein, partial [Klebsiella pneumoniae]|uniref:hypothetical protein n=1 Tax=Klebsiella pneumoniae TaxID=573 RepID=UPI001C037A19
MTADGLAHHGVLAHKHDGQSTQAGTDVLHLLGAHVVGAHARPGAIAPLHVIIPAQNTGLGPEKTSFFQALSIPTKIS